MLYEIEFLEIGLDQTSSVRFLDLSEISAIQNRINETPLKVINEDFALHSQCLRGLVVLDE